MLKKSMMLLFCTALLVLGAAGCSDDDKTTTPTPDPGQTSPIELMDLGALIEAAAPPEFTSPVIAPGASDSMEIWTSGDYPLLEKVFGTEDNQALYRNINDFEDNLTILGECLEVDEDGDIVTGTVSDSVEVDMGDGPVMIHYTATVTALADATTMPTECQAVMGASIDVDYLLTVEVTEEEGMQEVMGLTFNDTCQAVLQYHAMEREDRTETQLTYASMDPRDSSFVFKGTCYVLYDTEELFTCGFNIASESSSDFAYRMSWFSNSLPDDQTLLGCIVGGGNKDVEFALRYRQFMPADAAETDSICAYDQVFGPNYAEGTGLISAYEEYLSEDLIFTYDAIPMTAITNPWAE